ncbi:hypothetical protein [Roseovarius sp. M141]|uniref:hypothetical protein n=1 Tax=Roseovarius sp. M141 TaxID=2583806 RepID=UPI0020CF0E32|nr:hypothetical protein [Roseovarius sp. M141]MCQ0090910.1 hypothetical protein [Roseovarius sp. M141]
MSAKIKRHGGGTYSTYTIDNVQELEQGNPRHSLATLAAAADSIELELAATAVFLAHDGYDDPGMKRLNVSLKRQQPCA